MCEWNHIVTVADNHHLLPIGVNQIDQVRNEQNW
jgi:hypothetical protein